MPFSIYCAKGMGDDAGNPVVEREHKALEPFKEILQFWFGDWQAGQPVPEERVKVWFGDGGKAPVPQKFLPFIEKAKMGELRDWEESPRGTLALILLLDQFSRELHKDSPEAFATDAAALRLCLRGLDRGFDRELDAVERVFFYLPMEHSEDIQVQRKSLQHFVRLAQDALEGQWDFVDEALNHAIQHHEIIERFGRFPKRNSILGRTSTRDEQAYLEEPEAAL